MALSAISALLRKRAPGQLVIQYTNACNATCPQCGMRKNNRFERSVLGVETVKKILDHAARSGVRAVSFTGGEPLLYFDDIIRLLRYAKGHGIAYTRTGTNGYLFANPKTEGFENRVSGIAKALVDAGVYTFWISIDSAAAGTHEKMRGLPGVIEGIRAALPLFHRHGLYPAANLGINRNVGKPGRIGFDTNPESFYKTYHRAFSEFFEFVIDLGFHTVNACYPMSVEDGSDDELNAVYSATSQAKLVKFTRREKSLLFRALLDVIPEYRSRIMIFSPRSSLFALSRQYNGADLQPYPCRGGVDFFFVEAKTGNTYPCGFRGKDNLGKYWDVDFSRRLADADCVKCDWECFRDPSELFGPLLEFRTRPTALLGKWYADREYFKLWKEDIAYYRACNYFNGRAAPVFKKLKKFAAR